MTTPPRELCTHELYEREAACADGLCPICMAVTLARLRDGLADAARVAMSDEEVEAWRKAANRAARAKVRT